MDESRTELLRPLLDVAPDAVVVVDVDGTILLANRHTRDLLGYEADELIGEPVENLLPAELRDRHVTDRTTYAANPTSRPMAAGRDLHALHKDGQRIPVDIALAPIEFGDGSRGIAAFVRDATVRRAHEQAQLERRERELARAQALELNDNVVQGLATVAWLLDEGDSERALDAARQTLAAARGMMSGLLADLSPTAGSMRRSRPADAVAVTDPDDRLAPETRRQNGQGLKIVVADDSRDLRMLLRARLRRSEGFEIVAEAEDGAQAIAAVAAHDPDVALLDVAMPVMDGFEAARQLRHQFPGLRIVMLSGHPADQMREQALAAGADEYIEKGGDLAEVIAALRGDG